MLSLYAALACFTLPPQGATFTGSTMGVFVNAQLVGHDPRGVQAVAFIRMRGGMLGGSGHIDGYATVNYKGDVFASPKLRAALSKRYMRIDHLVDEHDHDSEGVPKRVAVVVDTPVLGRIRVNLKRV